MTGLKILVVDDDPHVAGVIAAMLQHDNHAPTIALSATEALQKLDNAQFDLVLTDQQMPGVPGDQLALIIKQRPSPVPVILVTSTPPDLPLKQMDLLLVKPFTLRQLRAAIRNIAGTDFPPPT
jgi:CheY-like chemotaxis protein